MKYLLSCFIFFLFIPPVFPGDNIIEVNFLNRIGVQHNAFGPLMVKHDPGRGRIILINTNSSSVSLIDGKTSKVTNIPVKARVPQFLKEESFSINRDNGNIYLIGAGNLSIVYPGTGRSDTFQTTDQYEMVCIDEKTGNCFLTGRESKRIAFVDLKRRKVRFIKLFNQTEKMMNLNQTPPPPIRKVAADKALGKVFVFDGFTSSLHTLDINSGEIIGKRVLGIKGGKRFHFAGYNDASHHLYLVTETSERKVVQALKIDCLYGNDRYVDLPEFTEGVGINLSAERDEVYIPYDNHPAVHIVSFKDGGSYNEVKIPSYGNDASAVDYNKALLYIASWAYGEIYVIDLEKQVLIKRIKNVGILPHMFSMAFDPENKKLFIPLGATAVNGSFGAAVTCLNTETWEKSKAVTGWAPIKLVELKERNSFLIFSTESEFAEVKPDGEVTFHELPFPYPVDAVISDNGNIFVSYGPHQSYWPVVYIWGAKNGIMEIEKESFQMFDRRIPRQAHKIIFDKRGGLYGLQNSWGKENLFLTFFPEGIRVFAPQKRTYVYSSIQRENIQRILKYDPETDWLYVVRVGEADTDPGSLLIINSIDNRLVKETHTGLTPTDLLFDQTHIYVSNFDSDSVTKIDKKTQETSIIKTGRKPLKILKWKTDLFILNHGDSTIQVSGKKNRIIPVPDNLIPDNMVLYGDTVYLTAHNPDKLSLFSLGTESGRFDHMFSFEYPYGETTFDHANTAFYLRGQFGDSIYEISQIKKGNDGKLWVTDLLSGRLFIVNNPL